MRRPWAMIVFGGLIGLTGCGSLIPPPYEPSPYRPAGRPTAPVAATRVPPPAARRIMTAQRQMVQIFKKARAVVGDTVPGPAGVMYLRQTDPWGRAYCLRSGGPDENGAASGGGLVLVSAGPDRRYGTQDDLHWADPALSSPADPGRAANPAAAAPRDSGPMAQP